MRVWVRVSGGRRSYPPLCASTAASTAAALTLSLHPHCPSLPPDCPSQVRRPLDNPYDSPECVRRWWLRAKYDEMRFLAGSEQAGHAHMTMRGWLGKQGSVLPTSRRRYFVVDSGVLLCYPDDSCDAARARAYPLAGAAVSIDATDGLRFRLELRAPEGVTPRPALQAHAVLVLRVESAEPRQAVAELEA